LINLRAFQNIKLVLSITFIIDSGVIIETSVPDYTISDHLPVCLTRFTGKCKKIEHKSITYRSLKHFSKEAFTSDIMTTDFNLIEQQSDINGSFSLFYDLLNYSELDSSGSVKKLT